MKKLVFTAVLAAASIGLSQANTIVDHAETTQEATLQNEKEIKFSEVPGSRPKCFYARWVQRRRRSQGLGN